MSDFLERLPTTESNRSTWTWSAWIKRDRISSWMRIFNAGEGQIGLRGYNENFVRFRDENSTPDMDICNHGEMIDTNSWFNLVVVMDNTSSVEQHRGKMYINGKTIEEFSTYSLPNRGFQGYINNNIWHRIGSRVNDSEYYKGKLMDNFFVDGQAMTAEDFGFHKQGEGAISIGSSGASEYVRGSWRPKSPSSIKATINRKGGFGTNGFYLPMNDKKMPGADHRIEIDSIMKLNQDLQQPKVGIASTASAGIGHTDVIRDIEASKNFSGLDWTGCVAFDGDSDYINLGDSGDFHLSGEFTIECWFYRKSRGGGTQTIISQWTGSNSTRSFLFQVHSTNNLSFHASDGSSTHSITSADTEVPVGKWVHLAVQHRTSDQALLLYLDGRRIHANTMSIVPQNSSANVEIGRNGDGPSEYVNGFISNLRIVNGSYVYPVPTALRGYAFTPSTTPLTNVTNTKLLCCQSATDAEEAAVSPNALSRQGTTFATSNEVTGSLVIALPLYDGALSSGFGDYSPYIRGPQGGPAKTITAGGNVAMGATDSWYGSAPRLANNGKNDVITSSGTGAGTPFDLGSNNFTLEFWARSTGDGSNSGFQTIFDCRTTDNANLGFAVGLNNSNAARGVGTNDGHQDIKIYGIPSGTGEQTPGNEVGFKCWNHFCVTREYNSEVDSNNRGTMCVFMNGHTVGVYTGGGSSDYTQGGFRIGSANAGVTGGDYNFYGSVQDFRLYNGVAKYGSDGFKVPNHYNSANGGISTNRTRPENCIDNFCTLSGIQTSHNSGTLRNGALTIEANDSNTAAYGTIGIPTTGKYYFETRVTERNAYNHFGVQAEALPEYTSSRRVLTRDDGNVYVDSSYAGNWGSWVGVGDVIGMTIDADNGNVNFRKNGGSVSSNYAFASFGYGESMPAGNNSYRVSYLANSGSTMTFNFGQDSTFDGTETRAYNTDANGKGEFHMDVPSGALALCTSNLPDPQVKDPSLHFQNILYHGQSMPVTSVTGLNFRPDLVITFNRSDTGPKSLYDSIRGGVLQTNINESNPQVSRSPFGLNFKEDGFDVSTGGNSNNPQQFVAHCWKAGGVAETNYDGDIPAQVSVNQTAGFSIMKFTAQTASAHKTVGHGLNKPPAFWLWKDINGGTGWYVYHKSLGASAWLQPHNNTAATTGNSAAWGGATPNDTTLTHGSGFVNQGEIMMYVWAEIDGISSFGKYTGNGQQTNGPVILTGFRPALVWIKAIALADDWTVYDNVRDDKNPYDNIYYLNNSSDENVNDTSHGIRFLSNGFKMHGTSHQENRDGYEYVYMAWAECPFKYSQAV